jgi:hypothetical protein
LYWGGVVSSKIKCFHYSLLKKEMMLLLLSSFEEKHFADIHSPSVEPVGLGGLFWRTESTSIISILASFPRAPVSSGTLWLFPCTLAKRVEDRWRHIESNTTTTVTKIKTEKMIMREISSLLPTLVPISSLVEEKNIKAASKENTWKVFHLWTRNQVKWRTRLDVQWYNNSWQTTFNSRSDQALNTNSQYQNKFGKKGPEKWMRIAWQVNHHHQSCLAKHLKNAPVEELRFVSTHQEAISTLKCEICQIISVLPKNKHKKTGKSWNIEKAAQYCEDIVFPNSIVTIKTWRRDKSERSIELLKTSERRGSNWNDVRIQSTEGQQIEVNSLIEIGCWTKRRFPLQTIHQKSKCQKQWQYDDGKSHFQRLGYPILVFEKASRKEDIQIKVLRKTWDQKQIWKDHILWRLGNRKVLL